MTTKPWPNKYVKRFEDNRMMDFHNNLSGLCFRGLIEPGKKQPDNLGDDIAENSCYNNEL
jgi:hypothetical protein